MQKRSNCIYFRVIGGSLRCDHFCLAFSFAAATALISMCHSGTLPYCYVSASAVASLLRQHENSYFPQAMMIKVYFPQLVIFLSK